MDRFEGERDKRPQPAAVAAIARGHGNRQMGNGTEVDADLSELHGKHLRSMRVGMGGQT